MITKTQPGRSQPFVYGGYKDYQTPYFERSTAVTTDPNTIQYGEGPKTGGHWPWKPCTHTKGESFSPGGRAFYAKKADRVRDWFAEGWFTIDPDSLPFPGIPIPELDANTVNNCIRQLDLNTSDAVLLYSGAIQAVPLLGGVMRLNRILKDVWKHVSKTARKKPFTTVIKDLIQLDFIDRFVIKPTLDDARKFQDAVDYCLRVINTARERNEHHFAVSSESKTELSRTDFDFDVYGLTRDCGVATAHGYSSSYAESKAFALVRARYDMTAVNPLSIWAQRVGLTRPLDSAWDLVPFSFVVDYFTRAGDFISALSDEMSSIDGLKGKILAIEDLWTTVTGKGISKAKFTSWKRRPSLWSGWHWDKEPTLTPDWAEKAGSYFQRTRVPNPWGLINSLSTKIDDYLTISLDLGSTRKRTIAELVIQARL